MCSVWVRCESVSVGEVCECGVWVRCVSVGEV